MKAIEIINPGKNSVLEIQEIPTPEPRADELLVRIKATAVNRADLHQRQGRYPPPEGTSPVMGLEMAGVVEKTGSRVSRWKRGDIVFALLSGGGYAEFCTVHEKMAMAIPQGFSFEEAAAIPETFLTAYQALNWLGGLSPASTVLIHAGGSGVGTAAIQLAHHLYNARIAATAGSRQKLEACEKLGASYTYNYKKQNFAKEIEKNLGENAVNLIIDFIGSPYWKQNMEILAMDGRLVFLSFLGGHKLEKASLAPLLQKRLTITGSTLRSRTEPYKIKLTQEFAEHTLDLFEQEILKPVIDSVYNWEDVEKAHQRMAENKNTGKIVLTGM